MAKEERKKRSGEPERIDYAGDIPSKHIDRIDDDGEVRLNASGREHIEALEAAATSAKDRGQREIANVLRTDLEPYAESNTVARSMTIGFDSKPWGTTTIIGGAPVVGVGATITLKENQKAIVDTVRKVGKRLTTEALLAKLEELGLPSSTAAKQQFSFLVQIGALTSKTDSHGTGYGVPEWS